MPASWAYSSSSRGAACPKVPRVNPGSDPRSQGVIPRLFKRKKDFVTLPDVAARQMDGQTDLLVEIVL